MASERVEQLESRVEELEATVSGLTTELIETRDRLREVEPDRKQAGAGRSGRSRPGGGRASESGSGGPAGGEDTPADDDKPLGPEGESEPNDPAPDDDIIVA
ncbi:chromosome segregation protein SMC [Halobacteriales archaeon QS_4_69_34]|nr:MAG: chromosome segregation protein SMC [Halobacteriales archaeon QS_4_69_34]